MKVHAIIVAAGSGSRTGRQTPKQFEPLAGRPVYRWSADVFLSHPDVSRTIIVLPQDCPPERLENIANSGLMYTTGGKTRSASVLNGLEKLSPEDDDLVLIHDAARPGLTQSVIDLLIDAMVSADAAAPALPVNDALKRKYGETLSNVDREQLFRVQTPQAFRAGAIRTALSERPEDYVNDLSAIEAAGGIVTLTPGRAQLHKITFEGDFALLETLLTGGKMRVGSGFDVHAFEEGDGVTLCGVRIPHDRSLKGHSDADVGWHALTDAIFGALALGDLGDHFPPSDERWKNADSAVFLEHAIKLASERGWVLTNCDLTIVCEAPKIKPHRQAMREKTAAITGLHPDGVSIKATTTEGLGFTGRREGIAAQAVVMVSPKNDA